MPACTCPSRVPKGTGLAYLQIDPTPIPPKYSIICYPYNNCLTNSHSTGGYSTRLKRRRCIMLETQPCGWAVPDLFCNMSVGPSTWTKFFLAPGRVTDLIPWGWVFATRPSATNGFASPLVLLVVLFSWLNRNLANHRITHHVRSLAFP
jgi:hypothetical protein